MARHHEAGYVLTAKDCSISSGLNTVGNKTTPTDDEVASDVDEPPDEGTYFPRHAPSKSRETTLLNEQIEKLPQQQLRKHSLLTQALLKTDSTPSENEPPLLTSDGGMTSPTRSNTPSPPLPISKNIGISVPLVKSPAKVILPSELKLTRLPVPNETEPSKESNVEAGLGRPRCIKFACSGKNVSNPSTDTSNNKKANISPPAGPPPRPCKLRFACQTKPSLADTRNHQVARKLSFDRTETIRSISPPSPFSSVPPGNPRQHRDSASTITNTHKANAFRGPECDQSSTPSAYNRKKLKTSEATRFHEFASPFWVEDDWIQEQPAQEEKITVQDTLRKENLIRRLAQEADEEALDDEVGQKSQLYIDIDGLHFNDQELGSDYASSDGGNETDDEDGFADSDDDSDHASHYQFWTSGLTTAATSAEHLEHTRPISNRLASESSIESMVKEQSLGQEQSRIRNRKSRHRPKPPKMRPGTPDLPDSTDFVCGTLDEDRPIEAAYMSCLEERRRSKHKIIPQDIDPSFPTSDLDEDSDDPATQASDEHVWVTGRPDISDEEGSMSPRHVTSTVKRKHPLPSPKRPRSPAPPRYLFGRSPEHNRPRFMHQKLKSPPSSRRASPHRGDHAMITSNLAQRPYPTHTTSLPRTLNPFWRQHRDSHPDGSDEAPSMAASPKSTQDETHKVYGRGPINIVKGLENKRQWRKERLYRQQIRHAGKDKERRCQPGKGAERMKELGLEMAGKAKGYCQRAELILSF